MRILSATVPKEMQTHSFVFNIPGMISLRDFPPVYNDREFELQEFLEEIDKLVEGLNFAFPTLMHHLELVYIVLWNRGYMVLRDKRKGEFYFELFFKVANDLYGDTTESEEIVAKMFENNKKKMEE